MAEAISPKPKWKNLGVRFGSAVLLLAICLAPFYFGGWLWALLVGLLGGRMMFEWVRMADPKPGYFSYGVPILGLVIGIIYTVQGQFLFAALSVLVTALAVLAVKYVSSPRDSRMVWAVLGVIYILVPCLLIVALRGNENGFGAPGMALLFFIIICVVAADVGAYFGGSSIGGPKLAPSLSPNKTWSGFFSGLLAAMVIGAIVGAIMGMSPLVTAMFALPLAILSVLGDLLESGFKRKLGVKDTGTLLPGHGGLLDRLDSLMAAVVGASILLAIFPSIWLG